jgi:hypothetical protein
LKEKAAAIMYIYLVSPAGSSASLTPEGYKSGDLSPLGMKKIRKKTHENEVCEESSK